MAETPIAGTGAPVSKPVAAPAALSSARDGPEARNPNKPRRARRRTKSSDTPGLDELPEILRMVPDLARRLAALEKAAAAPAPMPERFEKALARIDSLDARLGEMAARLDALADPTRRVDDLTARLAAIEARIEEPRAAPDPALSARLAEAETRIEALAGALEEARNDPPPPAFEELPELVDLVGKMNRRLKALETAAVGDAVKRLGKRLEAVEARLAKAAAAAAEAPPPAPDPSPALARRIEALAKRLDALESHKAEAARVATFGRRGLGR